MNRKLSRTFRRLAYSLYTLSTIFLILGLMLPTTTFPVSAEWDKSSLEFSGGCTTENCTLVSVQICNVSTVAMVGSVPWVLYLMPPGMPSTSAGTPVASGTIANLGPKGSSSACTTLSHTPTVDGKYMFWAAKPQDHPGGGDMWSGECIVGGCPVPTPKAWLTLVKNVDGGPASADSFNLKIGSSAVTSGQKFELSPGTHMISETLLENYEYLSIGGNAKCPATLTGSGSVRSGSITLVNGDDVTCTITNKYSPPPVPDTWLTLVMVVDNSLGGSAGVNDFNLSIAGTPVNSGVPLKVSPGNVTIGEALLDNYEFVSITGAGCPSNLSPSGGSTLSGTANLSEGDEVICTITNRYVPPAAPEAWLTLVKEVDNTGGGTAGIHDFSLKIDGTAVNSGVPTKVTPGTITISETLLLNYQFVEIVGAGCPTTLSGTGTLSGTVNLANNANVTCTIRNKYTAPKATLTLKKVVVGGGPATANSFDLKTGGVGVNSDEKLNLAPGTYAIQETLQPNYQFTSISGAGCPATLVSTDGVTYTGYVTLKNCDNVTCTITNTYVPPAEKASLTLVKQVSNTGGGTAGANAFNLKINDQAVSSGQKIELEAGTYPISETLLEDYQYVSITGSAQCPEILTGSDGLLSGQVTLVAGEDVTCTIANQYVPPPPSEGAHLTLIKEVDNTNGGTAQPNDFLLTINNIPVNSGVRQDLQPGVYQINETQLANYELVGVTGAGCPTTLPGYVNLASGQQITCVIENRYNLPPIPTAEKAKLTLVKVVQNNHGGTAVPADFVLKIGGQAVASGQTVELDAGNYTLHEDAYPGYEFVSITGSPKCPFELGGAVSLASKDNITCTITNKDLGGPPVAPRGRLVVVKQVVNTGGGTKQAGDFAITVDGEDPNPSSFAGSENGTIVAIDMGDYQVTEAELPGYRASYSDGCQGNIQGGETKTCTITNTYVPPVVPPGTPTTPQPLSQPIPVTSEETVLIPVTGVDIPMPKLPSGLVERLSLHLALVLMGLGLAFHGTSLRIK